MQYPPKRGHNKNSGVFARLTPNPFVSYLKFVCVASAVLFVPFAFLIQKAQLPNYSNTNHVSSCLVFLSWWKKKKIIKKRKKKKTFRVFCAFTVLPSSIPKNISLRLLRQKYKKGDHPPKFVCVPIFMNFARRRQKCHVWQ